MPIAPVPPVMMMLPTRAKRPAAESRGAVCRGSSLGVEVEVLRSILGMMRDVKASRAAVVSDMMWDDVLVVEVVVGGQVSSLG